MKSVLKRRKHRKGIRPVRKGTLKVRMVTLPTKEEHSQAIHALIFCRQDQDPLYHAWLYFNAGDKVNFDRMMKLSRYLSDIVRGMQKGYDYFREQRQVDPMDLALEALNEANPIFAGKQKSACVSCEHKSNCPFSAVPKHLLLYACPLHQQDHVNRIMKAVRDEPTDVPLTQPDMAKLALIHLS